MAGIIKVNQYQDFNGNTLFTSDGNGNLTTQNISYPAFSVKLSSNQTISENTDTVIQYDTTTIDTDNAFNTSNYRFVVPTGKAGNYFVAYHLVMNRTDLTGIESWIAKNGSHTGHGVILQSNNTTSTEIYANSSSQTYTDLSLSAVINLAEGDYIQHYVAIRVNGSTSGTLSSADNSTATRFSGFRIGS